MSSDDLAFKVAARMYPGGVSPTQLARISTTLAHAADITKQPEGPARDEIMDVLKRLGSVYAEYGYNEGERQANAAADYILHRLGSNKQSKDVARGVETADCSTGAVSASFASGGSEGATTAALLPVYDEDIHQCATCGGMIAPGNACLFSVKAYCSERCSRTQQSEDVPTDDEPAASWAFASSLTAASEMYHNDKHGPMCTCELSKLLREFAGGMMTERCKAADERRTEQALHPALPQLYERYDLAMKRVAESGLDKRPYWSGEATGLEIAINLLGGTTDDR